jgi:transcriptional regulator GlxA family with amidase domain
MTPISTTLVLALALLFPVALAAQSADEEGPMHLGIVLYEGFEPLDVFGPLEMFMNVGEARLQVHMIAEEKGLVAASTGTYSAANGPKVEARYSFDDAPDLDIILVPGGFGTFEQLGNEKLMQWLRERAPHAQATTSVCSGSAILAKAGLLDNKRATGNKVFFSTLAANGPEVDWVKEARWVDDGKVVTSSGVSAGMDMALAVIARFFGEETAVAIANGTEYQWHRDADNDPFVEFLDGGAATGR